MQKIKFYYVYVPIIILLLFNWSSYSLICQQIIKIKIMSIKKLLGFFDKKKNVSEENQLMKEPEHHLMKEPPDDLMVIKKKEERNKDSP